MNDNRRYWLWFAMALYPGNERIWQMMRPYKNVREAYEALCDGGHPSLSNAERQSFIKTHIEQCDSIIEYCENNGFYILTFEDENYPVMLRNIYNPPAVLFCMGDIGIFNKYPAVSCVGTRRPSEYSHEVTERICTELAKREFIIVSGFALGLDSAAHSAALKVKGRTAAVLACGLDHDYPRENAAYKSYIARKGAVITEYFPGTRPNKMCFQNRNRIISGLSFGTIVFEAGKLSGSLITANHALNQGRTVFCVPPSDIFDKRYEGVIKYLRDGALPLFSHRDVIDEYYNTNYLKYMKSEYNITKVVYEDSDIPKRDSRIVKQKSENAAESKSKTEAKIDEIMKMDAKERERLEKEWKSILLEMNESQIAVVNCFEDGPLHLDKIIELSGIDSLEILPILTELEMMGALELKDGNKYGLTEIAEKFHNKCK